MDVCLAQLVKMRALYPTPVDTQQHMSDNSNKHFIKNVFSILQHTLYIFLDNSHSHLKKN